MKPYGCFNYTRKDGYWTQVRVYPDKPGSSDTQYTLEDVFIKNVMSTDCRYDKALQDTRCRGCKHAART